MQAFLDNRPDDGTLHVSRSYHEEKEAMQKGMRFVSFVLTIVTMLVLGVLSGFPAAADEVKTFRRANLSNEFNLTTPEGINARGSATVG